MATSYPSYPVFDLHCDLLSYLAEAPGADPENAGDIGCAIPRLEEGNVKLQVLAIYSGAFARTADTVSRQLDWFQRLAERYAASVSPVYSLEQAQLLVSGNAIGYVAAIEGATALYADGDEIDHGFTALDRFLEACGRLLYIGLTHHGENRFGGGNTTDVGLKADGRILLDQLHGRGIAVDLAHTSDRLAVDILDYCDHRDLQVPIIASHSNFRAVWDHPRNLPDDIAREILRRNGLIGMNFLREFVDRDDASALERHIDHGLHLGGERALCLGADYFCTALHPDRSREPFFHPGQEHAGRYQELLTALERTHDRPTIEGFAWRNALAFLERSWSE